MTNLRLMMGKSIATAVAAGLLLLQGCSQSDPLQAVAEDYVKLALALNLYKDGEVDAWFGPQQLQPPTQAARAPAELLLELAGLSARLDDQATHPDASRRQLLQAKLVQLTAVLEVLGSNPKPLFADEAARLYGVSIPELDTSELQQEIFAELSALLPGTGSLGFRVANFRNKLLVPADRRRALFERALEECRQRTLAHWSLPEQEQLVLEWTRDVSTPWHRYEGAYRSVLQLNDLTLAFISTPVDVACHEGYPGHHAQFVLFEAAAPEGLTVENTLVLLRSPESAIREAAADVGVALAFPAAERLQFERDVLFPMAGLDPALADINLRINQLLNRLALVTLPIIEEYRDGVATYNATTFELDREALVSNTAELLRFVDDYGAYSVGYTLLREQLQAAISGDKAWDKLAALLPSPSKGMIHAAPTDVIGLQ